MAKNSDAPIADLIAQGVATRSEGKAVKANGAGWLLAGALVAVAVLFVWFSKPPLPVVASQRASAINAGKVLRLENQTGHQISVTVNIERDGKAVKTPTVVTVPPDGSQEFGWAEGWDFESGDRAILSHPQYRGYAFRFE